MFNQIQCSVLKLSSTVKHLHTCSQLSNHYDTLKISKNCSSKEIKESYIKLSKENHPDLNKNTNAHTEFLKIKEAYNVLSKPSSRRNYDLNINYNEQEPAHQPRYTTQDPWKDPIFYANRDRTKDFHYESEPYYGIKGVGRVSNYLVAYMCVLLTAVIVGLQVFTIRRLFEEDARFIKAQQERTIWVKRLHDEKVKIDALRILQNKNVSDKNDT